jgi:hypothetical protein
MEFNRRLKDRSIRENGNSITFTLPPTFVDFNDLYLYSVIKDNKIICKFKSKRSAIEHIKKNNISDCTIVKNPHMVEVYTNNTADALLIKLKGD